MVITQESAQSLATLNRPVAADVRTPGESWGTFLHNHAPHIAAMDLFVVPTIGFIQLYVLVIVRLARRELVWINVTAHPTAEWITQQLTEAFPWNEAPRYLIRDRDGIYGAAVVAALKRRPAREPPLITESRRSAETLSENARRLSTAKGTSPLSAMVFFFPSTWS